MLFNSFEFVFAFLPIVFLCFLFLDRLGFHKLGLFWLTLTSLYFYSYQEPWSLLLLGVSIAFNFSIGLVLANARTRKPWLILGITGNLLLLAYFKYANFFVSIANTATGSNISIQEIILPLAISFFTFQQIAYLVDVYKRKVEGHSFLSYCLFVTFAPQLLAGPIVHHAEMMPQFSGERSLISWSLFSKGLFVFCIGLFKKVVIADFFAVWADTGFSDVQSLTSMQAWIATISYAFQLYFDFSGYTDMAIGIALMFGITLPINFNSPYKAVNIIDFWRRWHITLSRFFRDYLYIPLGGNRKGRLRSYLNFLIVMVLVGLWHGAAFTFIFWGALHGFFIFINHLWLYIRKTVFRHNLDAPSRFGSYVSGLLTFAAVAFAWIFFRASSFDDAFLMIGKLFEFHAMGGFESILPDFAAYFSNDQMSFARFVFSSPSGQATCFALLFCAYLLVRFAKNSNQLADEFRPTLGRACFVILTLTIFIAFGFFLSSPDEFIYYRF